MCRVLILSLLPVCFLACSTSREAKSDVPVQLIEKTLFPDFEEDTYPMRKSLEVMMRVKPNGSVDEARILNPIKNAEWNVAAIDSIKKWRFIFFSPEDYPDGIVFKSSIRVELLDESEVVTTGELWFASSTMADSIYVQLRAGLDFFDFVASLQLDESMDVAFYQRTMELKNYSDQVKKIVDMLRTEDFSKPVRVGSYFVIYRKMNEPVVHNQLLPNRFYPNHL